MALSAYAAGLALSQHKPANAGNVTSDGSSLWSYGWWEMATWVTDSRDGSEYILVRSGPRYSVATACQFSRAGLWRFGLASPVETPVRDAKMQLPEWATRLSETTGPFPWREEMVGRA